MKHPWSAVFSSALASLISFALGFRTSAADIFGTKARPVHEIRLELPADSTQTLRAKPREYVPAQIQIDDTPPLWVAVHLKGAIGSFQPLEEHPSLTVDLDRFTPGQSVDGTAKLHLNNSIEDPSRLREFLGAESFRIAGLPSPRVSHAHVRLNGRDLGLYVLKEGFTDDFLSREFSGTAGTLWEPEPGADISGKFRQDARTKSGDGKRPEVSLHPLAKAVSEQEPSERWRQLGAVLDAERFENFVVAEVILAHRDGYSLARNNYRIFVPEGSGRAIFLPHGMDQLFTAPELPWKPQMGGEVARHWLADAAGQARYEARFRELLPRLLNVATLTRRIGEMTQRLRPALPDSEWKQVQEGAAELAEQIRQRADSLARQMDPASRLELAIGESRILTEWKPDQPTPGATLEKRADAGGKMTLGIVTHDHTAAAWRWAGELSPGQYRFTARALTHGFRPLGFGKNHGAALRVAGAGLRSPGLTNDVDWQPLVVEFAVPTTGDSTQLAVEFRAASGEALFACDSLRLIRLK